MEVLVNLVVYDIDEVPRRGYQPPEEIVILADYSFDFLGAILSFGSNLPADFILYNPFDLEISARRLEMDVYMQDNDGSSSAYLGVLPSTDPDLNYLLSNNIDYTPNPNPKPLPVRQNTTFESVLLPIYDLWPALSRLNDDYLSKNKLCLHLRDGELELQVQYPGDDPLIYTQEFLIEQLSALGEFDCETEVCFVDFVNQYRYGTRAVLENSSDCVS